MNNDMNVQKVPKRILNTLLSSLAAGVVPRSGAPYIAIGRRAEIIALLSDLEQISEGGGTMRFVIGRYGSGKSFLMQLIRGYALERDFITADADLSPERRLYGTGGSGVATYRELIKNLASKSSPDGGALPKLIARWIDILRTEVISKGISPDDAQFDVCLNATVAKKLGEVEFMIGGFDFARVISEYYHSICNGDDDKKRACLCWLRGEFTTKTEARNALGFGVSVIIDDENWYDFIKLWAVLVHFMGYRGLVVFIDECVNLYKISHRVSRENNYEKILSMFNDTLQGRAQGLGLILGGTPQFMDDTRRGLFSYEALRSRLGDSRYNSERFNNYIGPVIRLKRLSDDEMFALISRISKLYSQNYGCGELVNDEQMVRFLEISLSRAGADSMITPREMIRDYMTVINIIMQNPEVSFETVVGETCLTSDRDGENETLDEVDRERKKAGDYTPKDIVF